MARRTSDRRKWWQRARAGYVGSLIVAMIFSPTVGVHLVKGVVDTLERLAALERDVDHLKADVARLRARPH